MKKADRKNKTKLKIAENSQNIKKSIKKYKQKKSKTILITTPILEFLIKNEELKILNENKNILKAKFLKNETQFFFIKIEGLEEYELNYCSRYSHLVVLKENNDFIKNENILILEDKNYFQLKNQLINFVPKNEKRFNVLFSDEFYYEDGVLRIKTYLENGIVSKYFTCNGIYKLELKSIKTEDGVFEAEDFFKENENIEYDLLKIRSNEEPMDVIDDDENLENTINQENNEDFVDINEETVCYNELFSEKYSEYVNISDISDKNTLKRKIPDYFSNLTFPRNKKIFEGRIVKQHKKFFVDKIVTLEFKKNSNLNFNIPVLINLYYPELQQSIYNVYFSSKNHVNSNTELIFDTGVHVFKSSPILSENGNFTIFKFHESLSCGVLSFIGPISIGSNKIFIKNGNEEFIGSLLDYSDRIHVEEVVLEGSHAKINTRHSVVRNMFFNRKDVEYFKNFGLRVGKSNVGKIKEAVGMHGMFKAFFMKPVTHGTPVKMMLYKPVFPKE